MTTAFEFIESACPEVERFNEAIDILAEILADSIVLNSDYCEFSDIFADDENLCFWLMHDSSRRPEFECDMDWSEIGLAIHFSIGDTEENDGEYRYITHIGTTLYVIDETTFRGFLNNLGKED